MNQRADSDTFADLGLAWNHGFSYLGSDFYTELRPTPLPAPHWVGTSDAVAQLMGLDPALLRGDAALQAFTGNVLPAIGRIRDDHQHRDAHHEEG